MHKYRSAEHVESRISIPQDLARLYACRVRKQPAPAPTPVSAFVRAARHAMDLSQEALGDRFACSKGNVSGWENGLHEPAFSVLQQLATQSGVALPTGVKPVGPVLAAQTTSNPTIALIAMAAEKMPAEQQNQLLVIASTLLSPQSADAMRLAVLHDRITEPAEKRCFQSIAAHYAQLATQGELISTLAAGQRALLAPAPTLEPLPDDVLRSGSIRVTRI